MTRDKAVEDRGRMQALLQHTSETLRDALAALDRQAGTIARLESHRLPTGLAYDLHRAMANIVETLRWQEAWITLHLRDNAHMALEPQPHPWSEAPPRDLLSRVCVEIQQIVSTDPDARDPEVTERAVNAAIARAAKAS